MRLQLHLADAPEPANPPAPDREIALELSKEELESLIAQLESAKGALDQAKQALR